VGQKKAKLAPAWQGECRIPGNIFLDYEVFNTSVDKLVEIARERRLNLAAATLFFCLHHFRAIKTVHCAGFSIILIPQSRKPYSQSLGRSLSSKKILRLLQMQKKVAQNVWCHLGGHARRIMMVCCGSCDASPAGLQPLFRAAPQE